MLMLPWGHGFKSGTRLPYRWAEAGKCFEAFTTSTCDAKGAWWSVLLELQKHFWRHHSEISGRYALQLQASTPSPLDASAPRWTLWSAFPKTFMI